MEQEYSVPECPVCFASYDNIFKTPLILPCLHTFCMECLSKLSVFLEDLETFCCPVCRSVVTIPPGGITQLPPNMNIVSQFPPWMGELQQVWMEGSQLCWKKGYDHNYVTSTQNTLSNFPAGQEDNMVISLHLLSPSPPHFPQTRDPVRVPQQPHDHRCKMIKTYGWMVATLVVCFTFIFFMMFFPSYLRF